MLSAAKAPAASSLVPDPISVELAYLASVVGAVDETGGTLTLRNATYGAAPLL
jgi:hypothetical protein